MGLLDLFLGLDDVVPHRPVGEEIVEKEVRKPQKSIHCDLHLRINFHIRQLGLEPPQLHLEPFRQLLGLVQMLILGQVAEDAPAHQVYGAPSLGVVQGFLHLAGGFQRGVPRLDRLPDFLLAEFHGHDAGLALHQFLGGRAVGGLDFLHPGHQRLLIAAVAARQLFQLGFHTAQLPVQGGQFPGGGIVADPGRISFLPLFVQLFLHPARHLVEKRRQAALFQAVHIGLFLCLCLFQLFQPGGHLPPLGLQLMVLGLHNFLLGHLLPKPFQFLHLRLLSAGLTAGGQSIRPYFLYQAKIWL